MRNEAQNLLIIFFLGIVIPVSGNLNSKKLTFCLRFLIGFVLNPKVKLLGYASFKNTDAGEELLAYSPKNFATVLIS